MHYISSAQYEDISTISIRATKMSDTNFVVQERYPFALFPSLNFTCEMGYIVQIWFVGQLSVSEGTTSTVEHTNPQAPVFRLYTDQSFTNGLTLNTQIGIPDPPTNFEPILIPLMIRPLDGEPFTFTKGDFIGIMNPNPSTNRFSMLYHYDSGPSVYFRKAITNTLSPLESTETQRSNDYPLLAVETSMSHYDCVS